MALKLSSSFLWKLKMNKRRVHESHKYRGYQAFGVCVRTNLLRGLTTKVREKDNVEMAESEFPTFFVCLFLFLLLFSRKIIEVFVFCFRKVESIRIMSSHRRFHSLPKEGIKRLNPQPPQQHHVGKHSFNWQRHSRES